MTIRNDNGGDTRIYTTKAMAMAGQQVRISGFCASACNIYLQKRFKAKACAMPGAKLLFHMPFLWATYDDGSEGILTGGDYVGHARKEWARVFLGKYDAKLNAILLSATRMGKIPNPAISGDNITMYTVRADRVLPRCK